jgi:hypothetical protein
MDTDCDIVIDVLEEILEIAIAAAGGGGKDRNC